MEMFMRRKRFFLILILIFLVISFVIIPVGFSQDFNPSLTPEQRQQLEEYRKALIEELVDPIKLEIELENYTIDSLQGLIDWLDRMAEHTRKMYSPVDSPYNKMTAESSDEKYFTATADKRAEPGEYPFVIVQTAQADSLISDLVARDTKLEEAEFTIVSGDEEKTVKFRGGNINALERTINKHAEGLVKARTIRKDLENYILILEGLITGERNKLLFFGDLTPLQQIGMLYGTSEEEIEVSDEEEQTDDEQATDEEEPTEEPQDETEKSLLNTESNFTLIFGNYFLTEENKLRVDPESRVEMALQESFEIKPQSYIIVDIKAEELVQEEVEKPDESEVGAGDTQDLEVDNVGVIEEPYNDPFLPLEEAKTEDDTKSYLILRSRNGNIEQRIPFEDELSMEEWTNLNVGLNQYFDDGLFIDDIIFINEGKVNVVAYKNLRLYSDYVEPEEEPEGPLDDITPDGNYQRRSRDSIINYKGVEIIRDSNTITDFLEGVELTLKKETDGEEVLLTIDHDFEAVKKYILDFIDYNNLLSTYIYNTTNFDRDKSQEDLLEIYRGEGLTKQEYDDAKLYGEAYERLLYNDRDVENIKTRLRQRMMESYYTDLGSDLSLLMDMGIENMDYDYSLENPLLELDEEVFLEELEDNFEYIKQFFYRDTNEDNVIDSGLAFSVYQFLDRYRERRVIPEPGVVYPGPIYAKVEIHRDRIENELEPALEEAEEEVEDKVDELREQFIDMNNAKNDSDSLDDLLNGGGNPGGGGNP